MTTNSGLSPQQRLALSRHALVRHMKPRDDREVHRTEEVESHDAQSSSVGGKWLVFKRAMRAWWYHHPANVALDVAKPLVGKYAHQHPMKILAISAGVGAAVVFLRPWRLFSLGGLVLAAMKSSDIAGVVASMFSPSLQDEPNTSQATQ